MSEQRSPAARGALFRIGRMLGPRSRDDRLGILSRFTGRPIGNVADLTDREALVIDRHLRTVAAQQQREREVYG